MSVFYRDIQIGTRRVDFFVEELIMVELKAVIQLELHNKKYTSGNLEIVNQGNL